MSARLPVGVSVQRVSLEDGREGVALHDQRRGQDVTLTYAFDEVLIVMAVMTEVAINIARGGAKIIPLEGRVR